MSDITLSTTVDQHVGTHPNGLRMTEFHDVVTRYSDLSNGTDVSGTPFDALSADDQQWWRDVLADVHAAQVELAGLDADHRSEATDYLADYASSDLEALAGSIRHCIKATAPAVA